MPQPFSRFVEPLDPDNPQGKIYTFNFAPDAGDSLISATVDVVDATSTVVQPSPAVMISAIALGFISTNLYGVTFRAIGTGVSGDVFIRCRYSLASGNGDDVTYVLPVQQR